ncbi:G_PROTEIN_RECEP_F1_2 domain-containing protein [Meloidogyne graminicola]|uniref:G_PROTEIN_RECEP_F1_2 domain-containing protein n=1 Tax=Meloidogyne graminicola TaxID=189291 RepID=A0A8T0A1T7_9BILA|nr:G_PROTEIN_RECEP_F1_2 domain-containing protein [Meloidogyne graminicola]
MFLENENSNKLPNCNICLGSTDANYQIYNLIVSGTILALIGIIGLIGNLLIIFVYSQPEYKLNSTIIYLKALAISDLFMTCTAMFLFVLEAWRHHGPISLAFAYGHGAPFFFPLASTFQTTSVYFCVGAAIDLFINVALKGSLSSTYCTVKRAQKFVLITSILAIFYNIPHFFELRAIKCLEEREGINEISLQICPTEFRMNHIYYSVYYTYMYTVFMAIGPLVLLIILNVGIVLNAIKRPREPDSDIISLVLVVCLFIFCNFTALLVNFLELTFAEQLKYLIVYLVDLSNLLVVINCTANFFVYLIFGQSFRKTLIKIFFNKNKSITKGNNKLLINEENVKRKNKLISFNEEYVENIAENV